MKRIDVYTDGAVSGNPGGPGGAAAIVRDYITQEVYTEGRFSKETTNQRAELKGMILGFNEIIDRHYLFSKDLMFTEINIYSDSAYCVRAFNENWLRNWKYNGWITSTKQPVANQDLWKELDRLVSLCKQEGAAVNFIKVKGHSTNEFNNMADEIAVYCKKRQQNYSKADTFEKESK